MKFSTHTDIRTSLISRIWAYATAMFLIAILIDRQTPFLPVTIVLGATATSIVALRKLRDDRLDRSLPAATVAELQQRIENLEAIAASDDRHWDRSLKQLAQTTI